MSCDLTTLDLIAAGASDWQRAGRLQGAIDLPLCEAGRASVHAAAEAWQIPAGLKGPRAVWCGPDEASVETARIFAARIGVRVKRVSELREVGLGLWQGLTRGELEDRYPTAFGEWDEDPLRVWAPGGEPGSEAMKRVREGLLKAVGRGNRLVALVLQPAVRKLCAGLVGGTLSAGESIAPTAPVSRPGLVQRIVIPASLIRAIRAAKHNRMPLSRPADPRPGSTPAGEPGPTDPGGGGGPRRVPA